MQVEGIFVNAEIPKRLIFSVTSGRTAEAFVLKFAGFLSSNGWHVTIVSSGETLLAKLEHKSIEWIQVDFSRNPSLISEIKSSVQMYSVVKRLKPDVLIYATPKAALISSMVGKILRTPNRIYLLWGLRLETASGVLWRILTLTEKITSFCSDIVIPNSQSLLSAYKDLKLNMNTPIRMIGEGSSHGVDTVYYSRLSLGQSTINQGTVEWIKSNPEIPIIGFAGRLHPDKGIDILLKALSNINKHKIICRLLILGGDEGVGHWISTNISRYPEEIYWTQEIADTRPYFAEMKLLVLPSRREGFPNVVLEAASMGVPAIVSDSTGTVDSVVDGFTGLVFATDDVDQLETCILRLINNQQLLSEMGKNACRMVKAKYSQDTVWNLYLEFLNQLAD